MTGIGYAGAFLGGLLALASPCGALLLPAFFADAFPPAPGWPAAPSCCIRVWRRCWCR